MNLVVLRHMNDSGKYLFRVPEDVTLDAGTTVLCTTKRGKNQPAVCVTPSFKADLAVVAPMWGAQPKHMQRVTSVLREFVLEWPEEPEPDNSDDQDDSEDELPW